MTSEDLFLRAAFDQSPVTNRSRMLSISRSLEILKCLEQSSELAFSPSTTSLSFCHYQYI
ncbi:hypothetical protein IC582_001238 [Cucumis melo]